MIGLAARFLLFALLAAGCRERVPTVADGGARLATESADAAAVADGGGGADGGGVVADRPDAAVPVRTVTTGKQREQALGPPPLDPKLAAVFSAGGSFAPLHWPDPGEWLAEHHEDGESYASYVAEQWPRLAPPRAVLYLVPFGELGKDSVAIADLTEFAGLYFGVTARALPTVSLDDVEVTRRDDQLLATDLLDYLVEHTPRDAFGVVALTASDLYPEDDWNYVFGLARLDKRVAVWSLARLGGSRQELLLRALKVIAHEVGHMFGMQHCVFYECVMCGSNNLPETDRYPLHLCPICLRKLHHTVGFDPRERYRKLARYYRAHKLDAEAQWVDRRLAEIEAASR